MLCITEGNSQRIIVLGDQGSECTRIRLADLVTDLPPSRRYGDYLEAFSEDSSAIEVSAEEIYSYCARANWIAPISQENSPQHYSTYLFMKYNNEDWRNGLATIEGILEIRISAIPPYRYKSIRKINPDTESDVIEQVNHFLLNDLEIMSPPAPIDITRTMSTEQKQGCFNYSRLFKVDTEFDPVDYQNNLINIRHDPAILISDSIRSNWISIQNEIPIPITIHAHHFNLDNSSIESLSQIKHIKLRFFWRRGADTRILGLSNLKQVYLRYVTRNPIHIPSEVLKSSILSELIIQGIGAEQGQVVMPEEVLTLPSLERIKLKNCTFLPPNNEFTRLLDEYFYSTKVEDKVLLYEKR